MKNIRVFFVVVVVAVVVVFNLKICSFGGEMFYIFEQSCFRNDLFCIFV